MRVTTDPGNFMRQTMTNIDTTRHHATATDRPTTTTPDTSSFQFVGDVLALDLVNTEVVVRRRPIDLLAVPGAYTAWWSEAAARYPEIAGKLSATDTTANP